MLDIKSLISELINNRPEPFRPTILIVEDDQDTRGLWARVFTKFGTVAEASSVREAMDEIKKANVLVLDWRLNGDAEIILDGWMKKDPSAPVCIISGASPNVEALLQRGVNNVLLKPIGPGAVIEVVRRYILQLEAKHQIECLQSKVGRLNWWVYSLAAFALVNVGERGWAMIKQSLP